MALVPSWYRYMALVPSWYRYMTLLPSWYRYMALVPSLVSIYGLGTQLVPIYGFGAQLVSIYDLAAQLVSIYGLSAQLGIDIWPWCPVGYRYTTLVVSRRSNQTARIRIAIDWREMILYRSGMALLSGDVHVREIHNKRHVLTSDTGDGLYEYIVVNLGVDNRPRFMICAHANYLVSMNVLTTADYT